MPACSWLALIHSYWGVPRLLGGCCDDVVAPRLRWVTGRWGSEGRAYRHHRSLVGRAVAHAATRLVSDRLTVITVKWLQ